MDDYRGTDQHATPGPTVVIRGCDALVRPGDLRERVDVSVSGNRIASVAAAGPEPPAAARVVDGRGLLALPGLVNAHTHSAENTLRGAGEGLPLEPWLARMFGTSGLFTADDHYACALAGALEMLRTGATAVLDHLWMTPPTVAAAEAVLRAYRDVGLRAAVAPLLFDIDATGALAEARGVDIAGALLTDLAPPLPAAEQVGQVADLLARWHGTEDGRLRVFAGPCGPQWCSDELLVGLAELAERHDAGWHIHLLESRLQIETNLVRFGAGAVEGLDRLGLLGPRCSLAHCVWIDAADVERLAECGAVVVHNPGANLRLGSGRAPVPELLAAGVDVALGADGSASSDSQAVWLQLKLAALVHNHESRWVRASQALTMATQGGAAALGLRGELGTLEPGMLADIVLVDRTDLGLVGALDVEAALAHSETGRGVRHALVDGQLVLADGRSTRVDEGDVRAALDEQRRRRQRAHDAPSAETLAAMQKLAELRATLLGSTA